MVQWQQPAVRQHQPPGTPAACSRKGRHELRPRTHDRMNQSHARGLHEKSINACMVAQPTDWHGCRGETHTSCAAAGAYSAGVAVMARQRMQAVIFADGNEEQEGVRSQRDTHVASHVQKGEEWTAQLVNACWGRHTRGKGKSWVNFNDGPSWPVCLSSVVVCASRQVPVSGRPHRRAACAAARHRPPPRRSARRRAAVGHGRRCRACFPPQIGGCCGRGGGRTLGMGRVAQAPAARPSFSGLASPSPGRSAGAWPVSHPVLCALNHHTAQDAARRSQPANSQGAGH